MRQISICIKPVPTQGFSHFSHIIFFSQFAILDCRRSVKTVHPCHFSILAISWRITLGCFAVFKAWINKQHLWNVVAFFIFFAFYSYLEVALHVSADLSELVQRCVLFTHVWHRYKIMGHCRACSMHICKAEQSLAACQRNGSAVWHGKTAPKRMEKTLASLETINGFFNFSQNLTFQHSHTAAISLSLRRGPQGPKSPFPMSTWKMYLV